MTFRTISEHAPTGYSHTKVSNNSYDPVYGRNIPFPTRFSVYIEKIPEADGSQTIVENRSPSEIIGNKLYLWHRPLTSVSGIPTTITVSNGTLDTSSTNARQAYIVFSTLPTVDFTVTYTAAPDCITASHINNLQNDMMEVQKVLGPTSLTGYPGIRNLAFGLFDNPLDANLSGVAQRAIYLGHLGQNITIGSTDDPALSSSLGTRHTVQIGRETDAAVFDVTGFTITQSNPLYTSKIILGNRTGDILYYKGQISGSGPISIGGPEWPGFSGIVYTTQMTGAYYDNSMLRVHGDVSVMGNVKAIGSITILTATGTTSVVMGDWSVRDELFVDGTSHLNGPTETNRLEVNNHLYVDGNIILNDQLGNGANGQSLVDNLDCSEIAHSYKTVTKKRLPYSVIDGPFTLGQVAPKLTTYSPYYTLDRTQLVGEIFSITGLVNANAGPSGEHPNVIQLNLNTDIVSGSYGTTGNNGGVWSPAIMDPGMLWIYSMAGASAGFNSPIYGYTFESGNASKLLKLNVLCPEMVEPRATTNDSIMLYNPHNITYSFLSAVGGAAPTFQVSGSNAFPFKVAFDDEVRVMTSPTANISLSTALDRSVSGHLGSIKTGVAYIFASQSGTDPENPPVFKPRPVPYRMPYEAVVGEVVASYNGSTWSILETTSYRPGAVYDSLWVPIVGTTAVADHSGRYIPYLSTSSDPLKMYFQHQLGPDLDLTMSNMDLYLGKRATTLTATGYNATHTNLRSFQGGDIRAGFGDGAFLRMPLSSNRNSSVGTTQRDASVFYLDGKVIGIQMTPNLVAGIQTGAGAQITSAFDHLRLVIRRDV